MKSELVPTMVPESTVLSPWMVLLDTAIGATAEMLSRFLIVSTSERVRLDLAYWLEEVSSSMMLETVSLCVVGRTTMRFEPMELTWLEMRFLMLPIRERMRIMLATPMAMPRQVRKLRVRFCFKEALAKL